MERYLYRGVNPDIYQATNGKLIPRSPGRPFKRPVYYGEVVRYGEGCTYGESETNAIIMHQKDSSKFHSAGISTTPSFDNAKLYATHNENYDFGYVYKIDTEKLEKYGVKAYPVSEYAVQPAIPGDKEVILVADNLAALPGEIVVEIIKVYKAKDILPL
jgi:hypothetical protein